MNVIKKYMLIGAILNIGPIIATDIQIQVTQPCQQTIDLSEGCQATQTQNVEAEELEQLLHLALKTTPSTGIRAGVSVAKLVLYLLITCGSATFASSGPWTTLGLVAAAAPYIAGSMYLHNKDKSLTALQALIKALTAAPAEVREKFATQETNKMLIEELRSKLLKEKNNPRWTKLAKNIGYIKLVDIVVAALPLLIMISLFSEKISTSCQGIKSNGITSKINSGSSSSSGRGPIYAANTFLGLFIIPLAILLVECGLVAKDLLDKSNESNKEKLLAEVREKIA